VSSNYPVIPATDKRVADIH